MASCHLRLLQKKHQELHRLFEERHGEQYKICLDRDVAEGVITAFDHQVQRYIETIADGE